MDKENIIFKKDLIDRDINDIIDEIKKITGIIYYSYKDIKKSEVLSLYNVNELIGIILYKEKNDYIDLKVGIIKEKYRNKGYMQILLKEFLSSKSKRIYCASKNKFMIKILKDNGFNKISFTKMPLSHQIYQVMFAFNITRIKESIRKYSLDKHSFKYFEKK